MAGAADRLAGPAGGRRRYRRGLAALTLCVAAAAATRAAAQSPEPPSAAELVQRVRALGANPNRDVLKANMPGLLEVLTDASEAHGLDELADADAVDVFARLRDASRALKWPRGEAHVGYYAARHWTRRGDYDRARRILGAVRKRYPVEYYGRVLRDTLLAQLLRLEGRFGESLRVLTEVEKLLPEIHPEGAGATFRADSASIRSARVAVYLANGMVDQALDEVDRELADAVASGHPEEIRNAAIRNVEFELMTGRAGAGLALVREHLERLGEPKTRRAEQDRAVLLVYLGVAQALEELHHPGGESHAAETLANALRGPLDHRYKLVARFKLLELALRGARIEDAEQQARACEALLAAHRSATGEAMPREAVDYLALASRLARARPDASLADLRGQLEKHLEAWEALLQQWRGTPLRRGGVAFLDWDQRRGFLGELLELELEIAEREDRADGPECALRHLLAAQSLDTIARIRGAGSCDLDDVRGALLERDNGALVYLPTRHVTHLFVVDGGDVSHRRLAGDLALRDPVRELLAGLQELPPPGGQAADADAPLRARSTAARELLLPASVERRVLGWQGVTVVGAAFFDNLPFDSLLLSDGDRLLGEAIPVDTLSSLPLGVHMARHRVRAAGPLRLALLGTLASTDQALAGLGAEAVPFPRGAEVKSILATYGDGNSRALFDAELTREAFGRFDLRDFDVIQIVAHGVQRPDHELRTGLALADGVLWHEDLWSKQLRGLVILSACGAGRGEPRRGDAGHLTNLGGACLWQGAHTVVLSQADLLVLPHLRLSKRLQAGLHAGLSPAAALQRARAELAESEPALRFQRAQLQAVGLGQLPLVSR